MDNHVTHAYTHTQFEINGKCLYYVGCCSLETPNKTTPLATAESRHNNTIIAAKQTEVEITVNCCNYKHVDRE